MARLFSFKSRAAGTSGSIRIYVGAGNRATKLVAGVYAFHAGRPRARIAYGTLSRPRAHRWNTVKIGPTRIRSGRRYGISVLGGGGRLHFRDRAKSACHGTGSEQLRTSGLPISWHGGHRQGACAISAYVVAVRGAGGSPPVPNPPPGPGPPVLGGAAPPVVGTAGAPAVVCTTTLDPGANVPDALKAAPPGGVVCLNSGNWANQTITGLLPAAQGVTLAPAPAAIGQVNMAGITTTGTVDNLTVEGINFSSTFAVEAGASNITLDYNDFEHFADYAIELCGGCVNDGPSIDDVTMSYNQIDYTFYCLRVATAGGGYTFSHNVCGPGIGDGGDSDAHYIQAEGNNDVIIDNNAFEGPADAAAIAAGAHLNVTHQYGNDLEFDNNIVWQTQTVGQTLLWGDDGPVYGAQANNNLIVEASSPDTYSLWIDKANDSSDVTFSNDTVINPTQYGGIMNESSGGFTAEYDLAVSGSHHAYTGFTDCTCSNDASNDRSGNTRWSPQWQDTTWTPTDGSPWNPPPADYYKPLGISSSYGYQGTIGP